MVRFYVWNCSTPKKILIVDWNGNMAPNIPALMPPRWPPRWPPRFENARNTKRSSTADDEANESFKSIACLNKVPMETLNCEGPGGDMMRGS